ncbi:MAG: hypothetical protein EOO99_10120 [Pedobacter sp.]|nr:MAG: hypothetical protein EOO99_10120 [Pedobacter sp.]
MIYKICQVERLSGLIYNRIFKGYFIFWFGLFLFSNPLGLYAQKDLKVLTYNIHHANPPHYPGLINIDTLARIINREKPDLVALQEVDSGVKRSGNMDQAMLLAHRTGMNYRFFKAINYDGGEYGIAILSRFPILSAKLIKLPQVINAEARVLGYVEVEIAKKKRLIFANTHLDASSSDANRRVQMKAILDYFKESKYPVILSGDFNDVPRSNTLDAFDSEFERAGEAVTSEYFGHTFPQDNPDRTLDYVGWKLPSPVKGIKPFYLQLVAFSILPEQYASDHLPVLVKYKIK